MLSWRKNPSSLKNFSALLSFRTGRPTSSAALIIRFLIRSKREGLPNFISMKPKCWAICNKTAPPPMETAASLPKRDNTTPDATPAVPLKKKISSLFCSRLIYIFKKYNYPITIWFNVDNSLISSIVSRIKSLIP